MLGIKTERESKIKEEIKEFSLDLKKANSKNANFSTNVNNLKSKLNSFFSATNTKTLSGAKLSLETLELIRSYMLPAFSAMSAALAKFMKTHEKINPKSNSLKYLKSTKELIDQFAKDLNSKQELPLSFFFDGIGNLKENLVKCCNYGRQHRLSLFARKSFYSEIDSIRSCCVNMVAFGKTLMKKDIASKL